MSPLSAKVFDLFALWFGLCMTIRERGRLPTREKGFVCQAAKVHNFRFMYRSASADEDNIWMGTRV